MAVARKKFEKEACLHLPEPVKITLCKVPRPYVLVDKSEEPPYKTVFPNLEMIGTMWLAYTSGYGVYMVNAENSKFALYITSDKWFPEVGKEWHSQSNFRIYKSIKMS